MANGSRAISMAVTLTRNQIKELVSKCKKMDNEFKNWLASPPLPVGAAIAAVTSGAGAAVCSLFLDSIAVRICSVIPVPPPVKSFLKMSPHIRWKCARDMAVLMGCDAGIECVMKGIRGEEDLESSMVAGFGAGVMFGLINREPPVVAIRFAILVALAKGGMFKVIEKPKSSH